MRLALVEVMSDWRSLNKLRVVDGRLADYLIVPEMRNGILGVTKWNSAACTVNGPRITKHGTYAVADPRFDGSDDHTYGVPGLNEPGDTVTGQAARGAGAFPVADPGIGDRGYHANIYRVVPWDQHAGTITGAGHTAGGAPTVADPRIPDGPNGPHFNNV